MEFFRYNLLNGVRCVYKRIKSPVAYCALTVNAGSRDEQGKEEGIAHFTEHMLFKKTGKRKAYQINSRLEKLGGELNAFTTKEETVIHATTLRSDLPKAAELISDVVFNSTFPQKEIEKEKEVIVDEINSYKDSPPDRIYDEFEDMLFDSSDLGHNILGNTKSVRKFNTEAILNYVNRCYNTNEMVLSIAGNISETTFIKVCEKFFGDKSVNQREFKRTTPSSLTQFNKLIDRHTHQAHCIIGNRAYPNTDPKRVVLALLINILGGPAANSLLNIILREKNGLSYNVDASYTPYYDTGIASIYFSTDKERVNQCLDLVAKQISLLKNKLITDRQLSIAKKQFIGQLAIAMESKEGYMLSAGKSLLVYDDIDSQEAVYKKIQNISSSELMEVSNEIFNNTSSLIYK